MLKSYIQQEQRRSDEEDVEMALLGAKTTGKRDRGIESALSYTKYARVSRISS